LPRARPDLLRVVLDPTRLGIDLLVLLLGDADHLAAVVEEHAARASRALVQCCEVLRHVSAFLARLGRWAAPLVTGAARSAAALAAPGISPGRRGPRPGRRGCRR